MLLALMLVGTVLAGWTWLRSHPQHNPWAPLDLNDPVGWATAGKLAELREDVEACRQVLDRSDVAFSALPAAGEGACLRADRTRLDRFPLSPAPPPTTCTVAVAMEIWRRDTLEPAAHRLFGTGIASVQHLGAFSCRRLYGREEGAFSEHATGNAIDIAGFRLADGTTVSVLRDWGGSGVKARFLREVRDGACGPFATVLSPDYNAAHADHFHLDQSARWRGVCR